MIKPEVLKLLDEFRAGETPHTGRALLEHLRGTHRFLQEWGNSEEVCLAGLFHSIYGTQVYATRPANLGQREYIRRHIGHRAEELAYPFGACDRRHMFSNVDKDGNYAVQDVFKKTEVSVSADTPEALIEIDLADDLEQIHWRRPMSEERKARWIERWKRAQPFLSTRGYEAMLTRFP